MAITTDWHIHTKYSCDSACMEFDTLVEEAKKLGITDFGVTDHFHSIIQNEDIKASRANYEQILANHPELKGHFHFGMEASVMSDWEINRINSGDYEAPPVYGFRTGFPDDCEPVYGFDKEFLEKYNIEYVIGGVHWNLSSDVDREAVIKVMHKQYMYCATNPNTTILAHYLWWNPWCDRRFPGMKNPCEQFFVISETMRNELVSALVENNVAFEVNATFFGDCYPKTFTDEYFGWISDIQRKGVVLSFGGDCHAESLSANCDYETIQEKLNHYKIDSSKFFSL